MSSYQFQQSDADIDIGRLFGAIWKNKVRLLLGSLGLTIVMFLLLSMMTPTYTANTRVLIDSNESVFTRPQGDQPVDTQRQDDQQSVTSQVEIISSTDLLLKVADELNLGNRVEFDDSKDMSALKLGLVSFGLIADPAQLPSEQRILRAMRDRLDVYAVENSRVIVIEFKSEDPELAALVPNALAKAYVSLESQSQLDNTGQAADYLSKEIEALQASLRKAESAVEEFRSSSGLFAGGNDETLATQQLSQLSTELTTVRAERSSLEARVRSVEASLKNGADVDTLPDIINSELIGRLREQQIQLNAQIADLSTTLLPAHPRIKALRSQLDRLSAQITDQAQKVLQGLRNQAKTSRDREQELISDLNELKAASSQAGSSEVELRALERDAASQRALLESYLIRYREAQSRDDTNYAPANARLISRATTPIEPAFPKMLPLLAATFFGSLILFSLLTMMRELLSGRALVPAVGAVVGQPVNVETKIVAQNPVNAPGLADKPVTIGPANDNYSIENIANELIEKGAARAIIVSPEGSQGSICTVGIVRALADQGLRTILVDLTGTAASTQHMLENKAALGITDLLSAKASYPDVIHSDMQTQAHIIPTGNADPVVAMGAIERLPIIMEALSGAYDIVVIDCGNTNSGGLKRLTAEDSEIILTMVDPQSMAIHDATRDFVDAGYRDFMIVTAAELDDPTPPAGYQKQAAI